ncbi:hypothetical protein FQN50_000110 [Emmonsiellopsis sp. PD_5]|nr:hypothetical protein FQN50_000110 [Emmonsiellopsis sp. PD_5]
MDPLSIAAGSAGVVSACVKVSALLYTFVDDTRHVDSNVTGLCDEVLGLSRVLDAISKTWANIPLIAFVRSDPNGELWVNVKASVEDCQETITNLDKELASIRKGSRFGRGFMRKPTKQIKLNMKMHDIQLFRQQIQSHTAGMQSALQMINVCLLIHGQSSQELVMRGLQDLKSQIDRVEITIQNQKSVTNSSVNNDRICGTLQQLVSVAETFRSTASTVAGGSTIWGGSVMGDTLGHEQYQNIENWIPEPTTEESTCNVDNSDHIPEGTRATPPPLGICPNPTKFSTSTPAENQPISDVSGPGSDSDIETDLKKKFEQLALKKMEQRDYAKAEMFLRKLIEDERNGKVGEEHSSIKLKIAATCCFQGRWREAETLVISLAMGKEQIDVTAFHMLHTLAVYAIQQRREKLGEATEWCKRALLGKRKLLGKSHPSYHESMAFLAYIYDLQGNFIESEACRGLVPPTTTFELDPLSYLFKSMWLTSKPAPNTTYQSYFAAGAISSEPVQPSPRSPAHLSSPNPSSTMVATYGPSPMAPIRSPRPSARSPSSERLVVCVDLGATFTGVAWCFTSKLYDGNAVRILDSWPPDGHNKRRLRVPSVLYYSKTQEVVGWGFDIADTVNTKGYPNTKAEIRRLEWLNIYLYSLAMRSRSFVPKLPDLPPGKRPVDVVADFLQRIKTALHTELRHEFGSSYSQHENRIEWCFTVPPDADDGYMAAYRTAIVQAGYIEAKSKMSMSFVKGLEATLFLASKTGLIRPKKHKTVLAVKCGGEMVELMAYKVENDRHHKFLGIIQRTSDTCGSTKVNHHFCNTLRARLHNAKLLGDSDTAKIMTASRIYAKNLVEFENLIKTDFCNDGKPWAVDCGTDKDYPEANIEAGYMMWTNEQILACFEPVVSRVIRLIKDKIIAIQTTHNYSLDYVVLVGGFAENQYLFNQVLLHVPPHLQQRVIRPADRLNAAGRGALMYTAFNKFRTTTKFYLVETLKPFSPGEHPEYYRLLSLDGKDRCRYTWDTAVEKNTVVTLGSRWLVSMEKIIAYGELPIFEDAIYATEVLPGPYITSSEGLEMLGKVITNLSFLTTKPGKLEYNLLEVCHGPQGPYYQVEYDIVLEPASYDTWRITSVFRGQVFGTCKVELK